MFRIESYITTIILSYVDRYISNFKRKDAQVSLWEGDAVFHNLDLDLEVLDQEFNLPFSFVSGHVHELHIHVPWTRIASHPVTVTINTIECVMKLKRPGQEQKPKKKKKKTSTTSEETPPTYTTALANKVVYNLNITCNNLILKYVDEDIVLSMNIKTLSIVTVNKKWIPMYCVLTPDNLILRKLVSLSDVTICLDKRNASGRIESYLEPLLYKCSLKIRISKTFPFMNNFNAIKTTISVHTDDVTLSISEPQVTMLLRIILLAKMAFNPPKNGSSSTLQSPESLVENTGDNGEEGQSWGTWIWNLVPSIFPPSYYDAPDLTEKLQSLDFAVYIDSFSVNLKLIEEKKSWQSFIKAEFDGCFLEMLTNTTNWTNIQCGISYFTVFPFLKTDEGVPFIKCGQKIIGSMKKPLYEEPDKHTSQKSWEQHISFNTEKVLSERAPAFVADFISAIETPPENWIDDYPSVQQERVLTRLVLGILELNVTPDCLERVEVIKKSINNYDYPSYVGTSSKSVEEQVQHIKEDVLPVVESFFIPQTVYQFTLVEVSVNVFTRFPSTSSKIKMSNEIFKLISKKQQPYLYLKIRSLDGSYVKPLYPETLVMIKNQISPTREIISASMTTLSVTLLAINIGIKINDVVLPDMVNLYKLGCSASFNSTFQSEPDAICQHCTLQMEECSISSSKAKLMLCVNLVESLLSNSCSNVLLNTSLIPDVVNSSNLPYLKISIYKVQGVFAQSQVSESIKLKIGSLDAFSFYLNEPQKNFTFLYAGRSLDSSVFDGIAQRPVNDSVAIPFLVYFKLWQFHLNLDPSIFKWLMYMPQVSFGSIQSWTPLGSCISRKISNSSLSSNKKISEVKDVLKEKNISISSSSTSKSNFNFDWLMKWLSLAVFGEITDVRFTYTSFPAEKNCILVVWVPSVCLTSAQGKFVVDTDSLPVPYGVLKKNVIAFPLRLEINGICGWSICDGIRDNFIEEFSTTCTIALTTRVVPSPLIAFTLHIDTSHISLSLTRIQMSCLADFCVSFTKTLNIISMGTRNMGEPLINQEIKMTGSEESMTNLDNSLTQLSNTSPPEDDKKGGIKFSCWLQWTLTKLTISLYAKPLPTSTESMKLSLELEDIISSIDIDLVHEKLKMKIGSSTIKHYVSDPNNGWRVGCFGGIMMRAHESSGNNSEFLSLTITRATAANVHKRIASSSKISYKELSAGQGPEDRNVVEIVIKLEPLDFVISPLVLMRFMSIIEPILAQSEPLSQPSSPPGPPLTQFTTADLPLVYFDLQQVRIFLCSSNQPSSKPDTIAIQIDDITVRSEAVNPVSRKILRSGLSRMTTVPGSKNEDRQYQLDLSIQINTGKWKDLEPLVCGNSDTDENPAVTWNTVGAPQTEEGEHMVSILNKLGISFILAPPILTAGVLVSGLYFEGNMISEAEIRLSTDQLKLCFCLLSELACVIPETAETSFDLDSGIESADGSINLSSFKNIVEIKKPALPPSHISVSTSTSINTRGIRQRTQVVPSDVLITGKGITLKLFSTEDGSSLFLPLLYVSIVQPYISLEKQGDTTTYKASIFDLDVRHGIDDFRTVSIEKDDFTFNFLQSKEGDPDPYKGIPPALANFKSSTVGMKLPSVEIEMGRPLKLSLKLSSLQFLKSLQAIFPQTSPERSLCSSINIQPINTLPNSSSSNFTSAASFVSIKGSYGGHHWMQSISSFNITTKQLAVEYYPKESGQRSAVVSISELEGSVTFPNTQISFKLNLKGVAASVRGRLILTPWSMECCAFLTLENWLLQHLFRASICSDILAIEIHPSQIEAIQEILDDIKPYLGTNDKTKLKTKEKPAHKDEDEEIYKDDLQTGAFQFTSGIELPLPYQVTFPSPAVMAWSYPHPRAISSLTVLPVPFTKAVHDTVELSLEYLDPLQGWCKWAKGKLSESQTSKVELPSQKRTACVWRVILNCDDLPIQSKVLGGCLRVDSIFSRKLVPVLQISASIDCLSVCLWAKPNKLQTLNQFRPIVNPSDYPFATVAVNCLRLGYHSWSSGELEIEFEGRLKMEILNPRIMKDIPIIHSLPMKVSCTLNDDGLNVGMMGGIASVFLAPPVSHVVYAAISGDPMQPFIICNDTAFTLSFRQSDTNEEIFLDSLNCYFYSWKNATKKMELQFSVNRLDNRVWSEGVYIGKEGVYPLEVTDNGGRKMTALITIKNLSPVVTQVTFGGELLVKNLLEKDVNVRVVATSISERQRIIQLSGGERCASVILHKESNYSLRLALDHGWSGLIPLHNSNAWLVKVPLQEKDQFLSLWCQVMKEEDANHKRILVLISPMYVVKSLLPGNANVLVETQELPSQINLTIPGRGALTNLYAPGTTEHRHSLTFNIVGNIPSLSPHVILSYMDVAKNSTPRAITLNDSLAVEDNAVGKQKNIWPFLGSPWNQAAWVDTPQPSTVTRVKMRFCGEKLKVPHSIIVELEPWCLVVNTLGRSIAFLVGNEVICNVVHLSVVAPPLIEDIFYLLVKFSDASDEYHKSSGLQLSDNQSFYKPHIPGLIPQVATVQISINSPSSVVYAVFHSKIVNNIRLLHITSAYVICNLSSQDLKVSCFSLKLGGRKLSVPYDGVPFINIPKRSTKDFLGEPLPEWIERGDSIDRKLYLVFKNNGGLPGNPIPVPAMSDAREREALLLPTGSEDGWFNIPLSVIFQENEGTTYITIDDDPHPQLIIHNHTPHCLYIAASVSPQGQGAVNESVDWNWFFSLPQGRCGYYRVPASPGQPLPPIVVARAASMLMWSGAISLTADSGARLIGLPGSHDLIVTMTKVAFTIHLTLTPAHQSLISAADVRTRLSLHVAGGSVAASDEERKKLKVQEIANQNITCREGCLKEISGWSKVKGTVFLKGFHLTLCAESTDRPEWKEISVLSLENIVVTFDCNKGKNLGKSSLRVSVWDIQIDNQEHQKGGYDFSVVLLGRGCNIDGTYEKQDAESNDYNSLASYYRDGCPALDITLGMDVTNMPVLEDIKVSMLPLELFLEDTYLIEIKTHLENMIPKLLPRSKVEDNTLSVRQVSDDSVQHIVSDIKGSNNERNDQLAPFSSPSGSVFNLFDDNDDLDEEIEKYNRVPLSNELLSSSFELSRPLKLSSLYISPLSIRVSLHTSTKFYIALDQSPLSFAEFKRADIVTSAYRLGHALTLHYFLGAIYGTGWALGSLQLLGAPAGLARSLGAGLSSLVSLPCQGLAYGPAGFLFGVFHGSASLMRHVTAGTLGCVTKLAGSWSRTLDRLTLDSEDLRYAEEMRRMRPHGLAEGLKQGLTDFGVSLLGGVGGLVQRPLEYAMGSGGSLVGSVSRGLVGAMTRPLSGAASLVAVTTQGILAEAGWAQVLKTKHIAGSVSSGRDSRLAYGNWTLMIVEATSGELQPCDLVLTPNYLKLVYSNGGEKELLLTDIVITGDKRDPTLVYIYQQTNSDIAEKLSQKRITEYVRESQRALGSPLPPTPPSLDPEPLLFYLNPEARDYFVSYVQMAVRHASRKGFLLMDFDPATG
ncbi:intermembrane lipid transfer protein VPS13B [Halyomorpha halys]|uniref:intermembrane lipid transfer protein VPS13B n=1 Tax=Halyomorpha halys TaxID=286706 RepID=UPI0006D514DC|nr:vacuolar protein sorting-associated protein 13B [Halyomorpha halys]XP_014293924.1 vacuolar protein sorting-associated protein 13B [Halyomorpha halys]XP_014293925.1 vacuolar protein sorting-associated protein 13B [Halyomorpha halys]